MIYPHRKTVCHTPASPFQPHRKGRGNDGNESPTCRRRSRAKRSPSVMRIFFSVGEPSGDLARSQSRPRAPPPPSNAGMRRLRRTQNGRRRAACCRADLTELAVMWFLRAILYLPRFWQLVVPGRPRLSPSASGRSRLDRLSRLQLVDRPTGQGAQDSGVLLRGTADVGLGVLANPQDAASGRSRAVQIAVRGGMVPAARLFGDVHRPSVLRRTERPTAGSVVHREDATTRPAAGHDLAGISDAGSPGEPRRDFCRRCMRSMVAVPTSRFAIAAFNVRQAEHARQVVRPRDAARCECTWERQPS